MISNLAISFVVFSDDRENMAVKGLKDVIEAEIGICIGTETKTRQTCTQINLNVKRRRGKKEKRKKEALFKLTREIPVEEWIASLVPYSWRAWRSNCSDVCLLNSVCCKVKRTSPFTCTLNLFEVKPAELLCG